MHPDTETSDRPLRADARRNREAIVVAARELFAQHGPATPMDDIAARAGVGVGTVYRHFPTKEALLTELVAEVFRGFTVAAVRAQGVSDPWTAFEGMLRDCLASMQRDAAGRDAIMRSDEIIWEGVEADKAELNAAMQVVIDRAIADGSLRPDFSAADVGPLLCGITATMHFMEGEATWQRQLDIMLAGGGAR
jgi:AcrR family transcriptional regulator